MSGCSIPITIRNKISSSSSVDSANHQNSSSRKSNGHENKNLVLSSGSVPTMKVMVRVRSDIPGTKFNVNPSSLNNENNLNNTNILPFQNNRKCLYANGGSDLKVLMIPSDGTLVYTDMDSEGVLSTLSSSNSGIPKVSNRQSLSSTAKSKNVAKDDSYKTYSFDKSLSEFCTQEEVYSNVSENIHASIIGQNGTIIAYGATGTGKSHTIFGTESDMGIVYRAISDIFDRMSGKLPDGSEYHIQSVELCFVELYNNHFINLIDSLEDSDSTSGHSPNKSGQDSIEIRESLEDGVYLSKSEASSEYSPLRTTARFKEEAFALIYAGALSRTVGSPNFNKNSSRSHAILSIFLQTTITSAGRPETVERRKGVLTFVDLAGSERLLSSPSSGSNSPPAAQETQNINLSLLALGAVLHALSGKFRLKQS